MHCTLLKLNLISLLLLLFSHQLYAKNSFSLHNDSKTIGIYYTTDKNDVSDSESFAEFSLKLKHGLVEKYPNISFNVFDLTNKLPFEIDDILKSNLDLTITVGEQALLKILASRSDTPTFSLKTPRITLDRMRNIYAKLDVKLSGIHREQSIINQLALAKAIQPFTKNIYLLLGRMSRYHFEDYKKRTADLEFVMFYQILKNQDSPVAYFNKMNPQSGLLLLLDNPQQFSKQKIELLLPASFKLNIPMIGNRLLHGEIGALVSIYSNDEGIIREASEAIMHYFKNEHFEPPFYSKSFSIFVNQQIAQNFNMKNIIESDLEKKIKKNQTIRSK